MALPAHLRFNGFIGKRLHLGVCGSIAAYKALDLLRMWQETGALVSCTMTNAAQEFIQPLSFQALGADPVYCSMFPVREDLFAHLEPGRSCEAMVIAPATAHTLAKVATGYGGDMLSCQALSFPRPIVFAPAMNPNLWNAPATQANVHVLSERGHVFVGPVSGDVACGDTGKGRMAPLEDIYLHGLKMLSQQDLQDKRILLSIGPTREHWDSIRFWSNPSSGTMGASLAVAAWLRGARVTAVCGPGTPSLPESVHRVDVTSAREMYSACLDLWPHHDVGCFTAAVADFRPADFSVSKRKKTSLDATLSIPFTANPDILASLSHKKTSAQYLIGFAAETAELQTHAADKLQRKGLDIIVANLIGEAQAGFGTPTNKVLVLDKHGRMEHWPLLPKPEIAWRIWDWLLLVSS